MLLKDFITKIDKIPEVELTIANHIYYFMIKTKDYELSEYIFDLLLNINLEDCYKFNNIIVKKELVDEIINCINNLQKYEDLEKLYHNNPLINQRYSHTYKKHNKIHKIELFFKENFIKKIIYKNINKNYVIEHHDATIFIKNNIADAKEECKRNCYLNIRKAEIENILGD